MAHAHESQGAHLAHVPHTAHGAGATHAPGPIDARENATEVWNSKVGTALKEQSDRLDASVAASGSLGVGVVCVFVTIVCVLTLVMYLHKQSIATVTIMGILLSALLLYTVIKQRDILVDSLFMCRESTLSLKTNTAERLVGMSGRMRCDQDAYNSSMDVLEMASRVAKKLDAPNAVKS
jgi:hypothetical protein